jgi:flagellar basal body-associated protein FliL
VHDPNRKVVIMQWIVIAVLVLGGGIGTYLMMQKLNDYKSQLDE